MSGGRPPVKEGPRSIVVHRVFLALRVFSTMEWHPL
jgi:hypothetical protein